MAFRHLLTTTDCNAGLALIFAVHHLPMYSISLVSTDSAAMDHGEHLDARYPILLQSPGDAVMAEGKVFASCSVG